MKDKMQRDKDGKIDIPLNEQLNVIIGRVLTEEEGSDTIVAWKVQKVIITVDENLVVVSVVGDSEIINRFKVEKNIRTGAEQYLVMGSEGIGQPQTYQLLEFNLEQGYSVNGYKTSWY